MPKKRQSQPMQVWLSHADILRLQHAAKKTKRSQSDLAREGILRVLEEFEKVDREQTFLNELFKRFSDASRRLIFLAKSEAETTDSKLVGSEHLLVALSADESMGKIFSAFGVTPSAVRAKRIEGIQSMYAVVSHEPYSPTLVRIMDRARLIAKRSVDKFVQPEHLLLSLLDQGTGFGYSILELLVDRTELREAVKKQIASRSKETKWARKK